MFLSPEMVTSRLVLMIISSLVLVKLTVLPDESVMLFGVVSESCPDVSSEIPSSREFKCIPFLANKKIEYSIR